jgi:amino acid adenylation domain-containing protein
VNELEAAQRRALIDRLLADEGIANALPAGPAPRPIPGSSAPLSFAQQRLWFLEQFEPGSAAYNVPGALRLSGPLEGAALRQALERLTDRHEVLRTVFSGTADGPVQSPLSSLPPEWNEEDWAGRPVEAKTAELAVRLADEACRPFDLVRGPLLRARLIRLDPETHVLALTLHHIVADQWSLALLAAEMAAYYREAAGGAPAGLAPLPLQYADFSGWQRKWAEGEACRRQVESWRQGLAGLTPVEYPADFPRPAQSEPRAEVGRFAIAPADRAALEALAAAEGATPFMALLAVFMVQLHRASGARDVAAGTPVTGRARPETAPLIGFFTNTLVIRAAVRGEPTFREWLREIRRTCLAAFAEQDAPFELLVEALQPPRELDRNPWFDAMFVVQEARPVPSLPGVRAEYLPTAVAGAKFDLTLTLSPAEDGGWEGAWDYRAALFAPDTVARMGSHFQNLARAAALTPDRSLLDLEILNPAERTQVLRGFNATQRPYAGSPLVQARFEEWVERRPGAAAIADDREILTYAELEARSNRLARRLQRLGVGPDVIVGLCLDRTVDLAVGVLGVLKAGGCYLPLDPAYPRDRVEFMMADAGSPVLVCHAETRGQLTPAAGATVLDLDLDSASLARESAARPPCAALGGHLLYLIYTSGSTGRPKGIALSHGALGNLIRWHLETLPGGVKGLLFASLSFDASFHEMFAVLGSGGELYVASEKVRHDPAALAECVARERIVKVVLPVVMMQQIAADTADPSGTFPALREVVTTGEALVITPAIIEFFRRMPGCVFHNHYGPSETHVVTAYTFSGPPDRLRPPPPIGVPVANTQIRILDRRGHPAAIGVPGELFIGGANLGRAYHGRPELTADKFVPDPYAETPGARLYRTGDLARWLPSGDVEFLGRLDDQVKIRGFRVEPGEVETLLSKHPGIAGAAVAVRERAPGDRMLVGYFVRCAGAGFDIAELRAFLGGLLPDYMVPSAYVELDALPLTPSGKVERRSLPAPAAHRLVRDAAYVAPVTEAERLTAEIWSDLLQVPRVGLDDHFFHLGGHSLLAARLVARIRARTTLELPLRAVFAQPTLRGCVAAMASAAGGTDVLETVALTVREAEMEDGAETVLRKSPPPPKVPAPLCE